jgi:periplasmic copper chaperone A
MKDQTAIAIAAATALTLMAVTAAMAHVTLETTEAPRGAYKAVFKVPHGCDGSPTTAVRVEVPEGVIGVKPMPKPGWSLSMEKGAYARTYDFYHGSKVSEGVKTVTWSGGKLLNEHFDEFVLSVFLTDALEKGRAVYFPVTQTCETGSVTWSEIAADGQDPHSLKTPAPLLRIAADEAAPAHSTQTLVSMTGDLTIDAAWSRATPGGATIGAGYLRIKNSGSAPDVLTSVSSPIAESVEVHEMTMTDGIMRMRQLAGGLEIKPGETTELAPGGMHLMFMGLKAPLKAGDRFFATLTFKHAAAIEVEFAVAPIGASGPDHTKH